MTSTREPGTSNARHYSADYGNPSWYTPTSYDAGGNPGGYAPAPQVTLYTHVGPYVGTYTTWSLAPATTTYTNSGGGGGTVPYVGKRTNPNVPWYPGGYPVGGTGGYGGGYTAPIIPPYVPSLVPTSTPPSVPWHKPTYNNTPSGANPITNKIPDALLHPGPFIGKQADPQIALAANREAFGQPANTAAATGVLGGLYKPVDPTTPGASPAEEVVPRSTSAPAGNGAQGWRVGDDVHAPTKAGNQPSWTTVRARYWKNQAADPQLSSQWSERNLERMRRGSAPQRYNPDKGGMESMDLSHEPVPQRDGGTEFVPRWPPDHAARDPFRRLNY